MSHRHAAHPASTPCTPGIARRAGRRHRRPPQPQAPARWLSGDRGWRSERAEAGPPRSLFGEVTAIEPIKQAPPSSGAGAVVGGVLGAVVGNQVGSGSGRAAATVIGGVGGAVVGNKVEKRRNEQVVGYRIHVQLDRGGMRSFERAQLNGIDVGDRVRIDGSRLREI
ncbi:glycine zipper 2TM domain-containing protein [Piscinibacter sakaiensis]|uniref:glycine zipper 2TM domain-containing protein n=1 Tax=Piscinibacter sakaiensis TaxID=1547922 RepID=UPI003727304C